MTSAVFRCVATSVLAVLLLVLPLVVAAQQQPAGRVTITLGVVEATSADGEVRRIERGDPVFEGDTLRTGPTGRAQVRFSDRSVVSLRPDTVLSLAEYRHDEAAPVADRQTLNLDRGGFRSQTGRIAQANRQAFRVQTPVAAIGIRGTTFDAHQEAGGALLVGATQGGVEVVSLTGVVGRIGAGESFDYLRVNPDGSIDFLLETPEQFTGSPGVDEDEADEEAGALTIGDSDTASLVTGAGSAETTAGLDPLSGAELLAIASDPEATGIADPAETGTGLPRTEIPLPIDPVGPSDPVDPVDPLDPVDPVDPIDPVDPVDPLDPETPPIMVDVLTAEQTAALLAGDQIALATGIQGDAGGDGDVVPGSVALAGGIGTFSGPVLALNSALPGLRPGIGEASREDLLTEADVFLLPESPVGPPLLNLNVGFVPGLVWGRYEAPVILFVDPLDASRSLLVDRDILFALGTPVPVTPLVGRIDFDLIFFDVVTGGFVVADLVAFGTLDFQTSLFDAWILLDMIDPDEPEPVTTYFAFSSFEAAVVDGILSDIAIEEVGLSFFGPGFADQEDGTVTFAGFFTGPDGDFLQLAFDFRFPTARANAAGLALLEGTRSEVAPPVDSPVTDVVVETLIESDLLALAVGVQGSETSFGDVVPGPVVLGGGIGGLDNGDVYLALSSRDDGFPAGIPIEDIDDREDLIFEADVLILPQSAGGLTSLDFNVGGVPGLTWGRFNQPVTLFVDRNDVSRTLTVDRDILFVLGTPTPLVMLPVERDLDLVLLNAITGGFEIVDPFGRAFLDLQTGEMEAFLSIDLRDPMDPETFHSVFGEFFADVNGGVLENVFVDEVFLVSVIDGSAVFEDGTGSFAGFFTGPELNFLQLAFDMRFPVTTGANIRGLALFEEEFFEGALTLDEQVLLGQGFHHATAVCCFQNEFGPIGALGGVAIDPRLSGGSSALLGLNYGSEFDLFANPLDEFFTFFPPDLLIRRNGATTIFRGELAEDLSAFEWQSDEGVVAIVGSLFGFEEFGDPFLIGQGVFSIVGIPTPVESLMGGARYELVDLVQGIYVDRDGVFAPTPLSAATMSFTIDFLSGAVHDGLFTTTIADLSDATFEAFFVGQLGVGQGFFFDDEFIPFDDNSFVQMELLGGGITVPGFGTDPLRTDRSRMLGFFTGEQADFFAAAFYFETLGNNGLDDANVPIAILGNALLGRQDLSLTPIEEALFGNGLAFVGAECCERAGSASGVATMPSSDAVLGLFTDAEGIRLSPLDPTFGIGSPQQLIRRGNAEAVSASLLTTFSGPEVSDAEIIEVEWFAFPGSALLVDAVNGDVLDRLSQSVLFYTATPSPTAALAAEGFTTFSGADGLFAEHIFGAGRGFTDTESFGFSASFNVDLGSGEIFAGQLYVIDEYRVTEEADGDFLVFEELGFQAFFDGQVSVGVGGNSFAELRILEGIYHGRIPLDLDASSIEGFFAGSDGVVFLGGYGLRTDPAFGPVMSAGGVFALSNQFFPREQRLNAADVAGWSRLLDGSVRPSFGLAAFEAPVGSETPGGGVLLGRGNAVVEGEDFVLGATVLFQPLGPDAGQTTLRASFFDQPFDFVLRRGDATDFGFDENVTPMGSTLNFDDFRVSWGAWADSSGSAGAVQFDPTDPGAVQGVSNVFLASVIPTPISGLAPLTGSFSYAGGFDGAPIAFFGMGDGLALDDLAVRFDLDFSNGLIRDGFLEVRYGSLASNDIAWEVDFSGFLNGAITDLRIDNIEIFQFGDQAGFSDAGGTLTGVLTGPAAERHLGGFSLSAELDSGAQAVQGLWLIDRNGGD